jgi:hypothetical protein
MSIKARIGKSVPTPDTSKLLRKPSTVNNKTSLASVKVEQTPVRPAEGIDRGGTNSCPARRDGDRVCGPGQCI